MSDSLADIEQWVGQRLPEPYRGFLERQDEALPVGDCVVLYGRADFLELNVCNEVKTYCPECVTIGDDSGGRQILLVLTNGRIGLVDAGSMRPADARPLAERFEEWLAGDCNLRDPPAASHPERIDIYLLRPPADGLKGLVRVLKLLDLNVPASEYRGILAGVPCRLARDVGYLPYGWRCAEHNVIDPCLEASAVDQPGVPVAITPRQPVQAPVTGLDLT